MSLVDTDFQATIQNSGAQGSSIKKNYVLRETLDDDNSQIVSQEEMGQNNDEKIFDKISFRGNIFKGDFFDQVMFKSVVS